MNRRELLKQSAKTVAGIGLVPSLTVLLDSCGVSRERLSEYEPSFLSPEQFDVVWLLSETIFPATDTPGAAEAGVAPFVDLLFTSFYTADEKATQLERLNAFIQKVKDESGKHFLDLDEAERTTYLTTLDEGDDDFFRSFKRLTLWAFFTSEAGAKSANYVPVPGTYQSITIDDNEKVLLGN